MFTTSFKPCHGLGREDWCCPHIRDGKIEAQRASALKSRDQGGKQSSASATGGQRYNLFLFNQQARGTCFTNPGSFNSHKQPREQVPSGRFVSERKTRRHREVKALAQSRVGQYVTESESQSRQLCSATWLLALTLCRTAYYSFCPICTALAQTR